MIHYELDADTRARMAADPAAVKAAIAILANQRLGADVTMPRGIFKYEGGVVVNGKEIAIKREGVMDDWSYDPAPKPEEEAVVWAIAEAARITIAQGVEALAARFGRCNYGDPLRDLLDIPAP